MISSALLPRSLGLSKSRTANYPWSFLQTDRQNWECLSLWDPEVLSFLPFVMLTWALVNVTIALLACKRRLASHIKSRNLRLTMMWTIVYQFSEAQVLSVSSFPTAFLAGRSSLHIRVVSSGALKKREPLLHKMLHDSRTVPLRRKQVTRLTFKILSAGAVCSIRTAGQPYSNSISRCSLCLCSGRAVQGSLIVNCKCWAAVPGLCCAA